MGQVCDENISRPIDSNATAPGRIPSVPGRFLNAPSPNPTQETLQRNPHKEPGYKPHTRNPGARNPHPLAHSQKAGVYKI